MAISAFWDTTDELLGPCVAWPLQARIMEAGLTYDQLNCSSLASFEHVARRFQNIIGAHDVNASAPDYGASEHYEGVGDDDDIVAPALQE